MSNMMSVENGHKGCRSCPNFETPTVLWKLSNYPSYPPSIPSELFDTALEKCSGSNSTHAGRLPCPPRAPVRVASANPRSRVPKRDGWGPSYNGAASTMARSIDGMELPRCASERAFSSSCVSLFARSLGVSEGELLWANAPEINSCWVVANRSQHKGLRNGDKRSSGLPGLRLLEAADMGLLQPILKFARQKP
jgi:hypothetical protein